MPTTAMPICPKKLHQMRNMMEQLDGFNPPKSYPPHINLLEKLKKTKVVQDPS